MNDKPNIHFEELKKILDRNKKEKIYFWGASLFLESFLETNSLNEYNIIGIIDKNPNRIGNKLYNYEIVSPEILENNNNNNLLIIMTIENNNIFAYYGIKNYLKIFPNIRLADNFFGCFEVQCIEKILEYKNYVTHYIDISPAKKKLLTDFYEGIDKENYIQKYKKLIANLDEESAECVSKILTRITNFAQRESNRIYLPSDDDLIKGRKIIQLFHSKILEINENCYAYKQYLLPIKQFGASVFLYEHCIDKLEHLERIKNKSIIDVGGFIGDSAIVLEKYTNKDVHTFEPTTLNYQRMLKTLEYNDSKKIVPNNIALGAKDEELEINVANSCSSIKPILPEKISEIEKIKVTTLDKYVEENNIEVGLIKVDVEGFEQEFLKGALNTIKTQKPALLLSIYHNPSDFFDIKPYLESLNLGYKFKISKPLDSNIYSETMLIAEVE